MGERGQRCRRRMGMEGGGVRGGRGGGGSAENVTAAQRFSEGTTRGRGQARKGSRRGGGGSREGLQSVREVHGRRGP